MLFIPAMFNWCSDNSVTCIGFHYSSITDTHYVLITDMHELGRLYRNTVESYLRQFRNYNFKMHLNTDPEFVPGAHFMASHPRFRPDITSEDVQNFRHFVLMEKENVQPKRDHKKKTNNNGKVKQERIVKFDEW